MRKSLPPLFLLAAAGLIPLACGKTAPVAPTLSLDAGLSVGGEGAPADAGPSAMPLDAGAASPSATPTPSSSASPMALLDPALDAAIQAQAAKDAPGMSVEGQIGHATLAEGGAFSMVTTLQPGRCYTIVALSGPMQVAQLEVKLMGLPLNVEAGRSPATDKNPAVLGRGKNATCPIAPIAIPYRVDVTARKGAGRIGVAVYSRAK